LADKITPVLFSVLYCLVCRCVFVLCWTSGIVVYCY